MAPGAGESPGPGVHGSHQMNAATTAIKITKIRPIFRKTVAPTDENAYRLQIASFKCFGRKADYHLARSTDTNSVSPLLYRKRQATVEASFHQHGKNRPIISNLYYWYVIRVTSLRSSSRNWVWSA